jgi:hypothetical protein
MIDPADPAFMHFCQFAGCDNAILFLARQMTLATTEQRASLLVECEAAFAAMRQAALLAWPEDSSRNSAVDLLEERVKELAHTPSQNDFLKTWGGKRCTVCGTKIAAPKAVLRLAYCPHCISGVHDARIALKAVVGAETAELMV